MLVHVRQLRTLLAGVKTGAGGLKACGGQRLLIEFFHRGGGAGIQPDPRIIHRLIISTDQPAAIALGGHRHGHHARRQILHPIAELVNRTDRILPGLRH